MTEIPDPASLVAAAQQAAAAGDYPTAAHRLRDAADWQERQLGPNHPDLVNTLNNLGVVLERAGRLEEAEAAFRRGYAIARGVFPADHHVVVTAAANLREFCDANGVVFEPGARPEPPRAAVQTEPAGLSEFPLEQTLTLERPPSPVTETAPSSRSQPPRDPVTRSLPASFPASPTANFVRPTGRVSGPPPPNRTAPAASPAPVFRSADDPAPRSMRPFVAGGLVLLALVFAVWLMMPRAGEDGSAPDPAQASPPAPAASTPPTPSPAPSTGGAADTGRAAGAAQSTREPVTETAQAAQPDRPRGSVPPGAGGAVVSAELCRTLVTRPGAEGWNCTPAASPVAPGVLVFLTRIRSAAPTTVHHRWYRGDALRQQVGLRIQPNPQGYRTYSRLAVDEGAWRVEVRSASGALLQEQRFEVR